MSIPFEAASRAVEGLYRLEDEEFDRLFNIKASNLRGQMLTEFSQSEALCPDADEALSQIGQTLLLSHELAADGANLSDAAKSDYKTQMGRVVTDAVVVLQECLESNSSRGSVGFQLAAAKAFGLPIENE